jgi:deoxyhypusine synthase
MASTEPNAAPAGAKDAVLVKSDAMPEGAKKVKDFDFNMFKGPLSAEDLLLGMQHMGFQASSIGEAVRIINDMVRD